jgi:deoxyribonuclease V
VGNPRKNFAIYGLRNLQSILKLSIPVRSPFSTLSVGSFSSLDGPAQVLYTVCSLCFETHRLQRFGGAQPFGKVVLTGSGTTGSRWPRTFPEGRALQEALRRRVRIQPFRGRIRRIAGCDVSFERAYGKLFAAVVVFRWPGLEPVEMATAVGEADFPYVPGYLSFREGPVLEKAYEKLERRPNLVIFDGQGIAHPRRFGLASHLGVVWRVPSVGCAKTRLVGTARDPGIRKGDWTPLRDGREVIGSVLRTRDRVKPVFVSPGHRIDHRGARRVVLEATTRYRLPEPIRAAHREVNVLRRAWIARFRPDLWRG